MDTEKEKLPMYLYKRPENGVFYFRRPIPPQLKGKISKVDFHHSLKTQNRKEALKAFPISLARSNEILQRVLAELSPTPEPIAGRKVPPRPIGPLVKPPRTSKPHKSLDDFTESQITTLVLQWHRQRMATAEKGYRLMFSMWDTSQKMDELFSLSQDESFLMGEHPPMGDMLISRAVMEVLDSADCRFSTAETGTPLYKHLYSLTHQSLLRENRFSNVLLETGKVETADALPSTLTMALVPQAQNNLSNATSSGLSKTLDDLIENFENHPARRDLAQKTKDEYGIIYRALREHIGGQTLVGDVTREQLTEIQDTFLKLPARATTRFPKLTLRQAALKAHKEGIDPIETKTFNKRIHAIAALFNHAVKEHLILKSPAQGLGMPEDKNPFEKKPPFNGVQLNTIFSSKTYILFAKDRDAKLTPNHALRPCFFWTPLIGLFQGMRLNEILQLQVVDVDVREGIQSIRVQANEDGQSVKSKAGWRDIPIHPTLIELGFLEYVENVKKGGHKGVFPDAVRASDGKYSSWFQKYFSRYLKQIGVKVDDGAKLSFHSFRHTFTDGLRNAEVPQDIRRALGGWSDHTSLESHYGGKTLSRLEKHLSTLAYEGLDLSHLK